MLNYSQSEEQSIKEVVAAVRRSRNTSSTNSLKSLALSAEEEKNTFDSDVKDAELQFDYNKNPKAVSEADEKKIRFVMQVVQQQGTNQLSNAGKDFTNNSEVWIEFFTKYPLLFSFRSRQSKKLTENEFTLSVNSALVGACLDSQSPTAIKEAFIQALKSSGGEALSKTDKTTNLQYLAIIREYDKASTLTLYKAELRMEVSKVKTICGGGSKVDLSIAYDQVVLEMSNELALAIYPKLASEAAEIATEFMSSFFKKFAEEEFDRFDQWLKSLGK